VDLVPAADNKLINQCMAWVLRGKARDRRAWGHMDADGWLPIDLLVEYTKREHAQQVGWHDASVSLHRVQLLLGQDQQLQPGARHGCMRFELLFDDAGEVECVRAKRKFFPKT
jgi:hypothetical protein